MPFTPSAREAPTRTRGARERRLVVFVSAFVHSIADSEIEDALYVVFS